MENSTYQEISPEFYDHALEKSNPFTKHYHHDRYHKIRKFLSSRYKKNHKIADLGCGSSGWNTQKLPVFGIDISKNLIDYGISKKRITDYVLCDMENEKIPLDDNSFDFIIVSEVLEHMKNPLNQLSEANRLLKKNGFLIITVPLDVPLSSWWFLFNAGCVLRGDLLGNKYFKERCGHIQHFSVSSISDLILKSGFEIVEKNITWLNIGIIAKKL